MLLHQEILVLIPNKDELCRILKIINASNKKLKLKYEIIYILDFYTY